jgi:hypothetical protein
LYSPKPQFILKYGYPAETHNVTTTDGYILTLHRIPYSPKSPVAPNKPAAFVQHGLLGSSADWIILGPNKSLGEFQCHLYKLLKYYLKRKERFS